MSFLDVYNALYTQLSNNPILTAYSGITFEKVYKEPVLREKYTLLLNPTDSIEVEDSQSYRNSYIKEITYNIGLAIRMIFAGKKLEEYILGWTEIRESDTFYKGILCFMEDVKDVVRKDETLGYDSAGYSESISNTSGTFNLTNSQRYITVSIHGRMPNGYDTIDCGNTTLDGDTIALNIQNSLRALETPNLRSNDGYKNVVVTFNATNNRFKIEPVQTGPTSRVEVSAGASNDCSALLGFDNPTEERGKEIVKIEFDPVIQLDGEIGENKKYPVIVRATKLFITESRYVGG